MNPCAKLVPLLFGSLQGGQKSEALYDIADVFKTPKSISIIYAN